MAYRGRREEPIELNLTPMIDVLFLLLIFFMVGAKFTDDVRELDVRLPEVRQETPANLALSRMAIAVHRDGRLTLDQDTLSLEDLEQQLTKLASDPQQAVSVAIWGDAGVEFQRVAEVLAACRVAGITDMAVSVNVR